MRDVLKEIVRSIARILWGTRTKDVLKERRRLFGGWCARLPYKEKDIPEGGGLSLRIELKRKYFPVICERNTVRYEFYIGARSCEELGLTYDYNRALMGVVPNEKRMFELGNLSSRESFEYIKSAERIVFTGLSREGSELLYCPASHPFDEEVFRNQRDVLFGKVPWIKLFALRCGLLGQVKCDFYNERSQRLSTFILICGDDVSHFMPFSASIEYGLEKYFVVYESGESFASNYVLQYADAKGESIQRKTVVSASALL